jgi:hypothetical protein
VGAYDNLVLGHESLLLSPPIPVKQTIPLDTQRLPRAARQVYATTPRVRTNPDCEDQEETSLQSG